MVKDEEIAAVSGDLGLTLIDWPESERRKFREAAAQVWRELSAESPAAMRIVESQTDFLKKLGRL